MTETITDGLPADDAATGDARMRPADAALLVLLAAIWGGSFLFMRVAAPEFGPVPLIGVRLVIASLFLAPLLAARGGFAQVRANTGAVFLVGVVNSALPFSLLAYATLHLTAGLASILNATAPFFAAVVAWAWLNDRLPPARVAGLGIGFGGVVVLVWGRASFHAGGTGPAVAAGLGAGLFYGIAANCTKRYLSGVGPLPAATGSQVGAALALLPLAAWAAPVACPSAKAWGMVAALGVICTGVAYLIYFRLIARLGPARAVAVTLLVPVFGVLWGRVFLHEPVTGQMIVGGMIVLTGTALTTGLLQPPGSWGREL